MKAPKSSDLMGRLKALGTGWILFLLIVIFAIVMLGAFVSIPIISGTGPLYNVAGGMVVLFLLFVYEVYVSSSSSAKLTKKLTSLLSGTDASVQSMRRNLEESASETRRRFVALEANVAKIGDGAARSGESVSSLQRDIPVLRGQLDKLSEATEGIRDAVAASEKTLAKAAEASSRFRHEVDELGVKLSEVAEELKGLGEMVSKVEAHGADTRAGVDGINESITNLKKAIAELKTSVSVTGERAAVTGKAVALLQKKTSGLEKKVSSVDKDRRKVTKVEREVTQMKGRLARMAKTEARISTIEKSVSRIGSKVSKPSSVPKKAPRRVRRASRRKPRIVSAPKPAEPVPEEVRQLEAKIHEPQDSQTAEKQESPERSPR